MLYRRRRKDGNMANAKKNRTGRQEPTSSRVLRYEKTLGKEAIDLYEVRDKVSYPWQQLQIYDIMAVNDDGQWIHTRYGFEVARRNGKNEIITIRELWGLKHGEQILHTAHRTDTSHKAWERLKKAVEDAGLNITSSYRAYGKEHIEVEGGGRVEFRTRTSTGGLGAGYDLLIIDEAQEYQDSHESALKYTVTDSSNPQTIFCGTPPTPVSSGTVFVKYRAATLAGENANAGWAEWSVADMTDPRNKDAWYETNPSLGYHLKERAILDEIGEDDLDFNIQRLGFWTKQNLKSAISEAEWMQLKAPKLPALRGRLYVGIKYGKDGQNVSMSIAAKTKDDQVFVEAIDCRPARAGTAWIISFLKQADIRKVAVDGASGQTLLAGDMKDAGLKVPIMPTVKEIITINSTFEQGIYEETICHMGQPSLTQAVGNCEKRAIGSNGGFGYKALKEGIEIGLMDSAAIAHWLCRETKEAKPQRVSY